MTYAKWIALSGVIWAVIGISLLTKGLSLLAQAINTPSSLTLSLSTYLGSEEKAILFLLGTALLIGYSKGKFVLSRTVKRVVQRIHSLDLPIKFSQVYSRKYLLLILLMMALGFTMKKIGLSKEMRGTIDCAVGAALIQGALLYFRFALIRKKNKELF